MKMVEIKMFFFFTSVTVLFLKKFLYGSCWLKIAKLQDMRLTSKRLLRYIVLPTVESYSVLFLIAVKKPPLVTTDP